MFGGRIIQKPVFYNGNLRIIKKPLFYKGNLRIIKKPVFVQGMPKVRILDQMQIVLDQHLVQLARHRTGLLLRERWIPIPAVWKTWMVVVAELLAIGLVSQCLMSRQMRLIPEFIGDSSDSIISTNRCSLNDRSALSLSQRF